MSDDVVDDPEFGGDDSKAKSRRGFRIIELMAVVAIIAVLIALMLPAVRSGREAARRSQCVNNLKQIWIALQNYEAEYGALPPAYTVDKAGRRLHSWRTLILPYLDQEALYRTIDLAKPWDDPVNREARETALGVYHCPGAEGAEGTTTYLAVVGEDACFGGREARKLEEITDRPEQTLMVVEAGEEDAVPWMAPVDADEALVLGLGPESKLSHAGGVNSCFVDGSVHFLQIRMTADVRRAVSTRNGGETFPVRSY